MTTWHDFAAFVALALFISMVLMWAQILNHI